MKDEAWLEQDLDLVRVLLHLINQGEGWVRPPGFADTSGLCSRPGRKSAHLQYAKLAPGRYRHLLSCFRGPRWA